MNFHFADKLAMTGFDFAFDSWELHAISSRNNERFNDLSILVMYDDHTNSADKKNRHTMNLHYRPTATSRLVRLPTPANNHNQIYML